MQRISEDTHICYAVLRGKSNQQLFEEEIQKMKILDAAAKIRERMQVQVLAYCVLDNELHLLLRLEEEQSADHFLEAIARYYEETCPGKDRSPLRVDYLPRRNQLPEVNSSVHEKGIFYDANSRIRFFRKNTVRTLKDPDQTLSYVRKLHMLPVKGGFVSDPEDYWWCSYLDYLGRQWIPLADTSPILSQFSDNFRLAAKMLRQYHRKLLKHTPVN